MRNPSLKIMSATRRLCVKWLGLLWLATSASSAAPQGGSSSAPAACGELSFPSSVIVNPAINVTSRLNAVHALGRDLKSSEVAALCHFIKALPSVREKNLPALQLIKNDLMNALMTQNVPPSQLADTIISTFEDQRQDLVTRDYALQHLVTWYPQSAGPAKIREVLWLAASGQDSLAGTALLGLHRLAAGDAAFSLTDIRNRAVNLVTGNETALTARITAIQICAEEQATEALPRIRSLALSQTPAALRISAIAALGCLGGTQDILALEQMRKGAGPELQVAIESALKRLKQQEFRIQKVV